jgi:hypothetical protein
VPRIEAGWHDNSLAFAGNSPSLTDMTWFPRPPTKVHLEPKDVRGLLTGEADIVLQTGEWKMYNQQGSQFFWHWIPYTQHILNLKNQPNSRDQLVIKASPDITQRVENLIMIHGHVWLGQYFVSRSEYDAFMFRVFSQHGSHTPQATRASVLAWASRPSSDNEPMWQAHLLFTMLASLNATNSDQANFHESSQVLASRAAPWQDEWRRGAKETQWTKEMFMWEDLGLDW